MNQHLRNLAFHNISSLYDLAEVVQVSGQSPESDDPRQDIATLIRELFHVVAWSDRALHARESQIYELALEVDAAHGGHLGNLQDAEVNPNPTSEVDRGVLRVASLLDARHGSQIVALIMNHLENLAFLIAMADARISNPEVASYKRFIDRLRKSTNAVHTSDIEDGFCRLSCCESTLADGSSVCAWAGGEPCQE